MPSSSARCAQLPRAMDKVPFYSALKKFRDYLNGLIPEIDDSEVIFNDPKIRAADDGTEISEHLKRTDDYENIVFFNISLIIWNFNRRFALRSIHFGRISWRRKASNTGWRYRQQPGTNSTCQKETWKAEENSDWRVEPSETRNFYSVNQFSCDVRWSTRLI